MRSAPVRSTDKTHTVDPRGAQQPHVHARNLPGHVAALGALHRTHGNRFVQRLLTAAPHADVEAPSGVQDAIERTRGGGQMLQRDVRIGMESLFGADFGGVRLHTDAEADALSGALRARAFTTGRDIYFRQGEYEPHASAGRRLLAHELTHVVQQDGSAASSALLVGAPHDAYEQEADHVAETVMHSPARENSSGPSVSAGIAAGSIQRMCAACADAAHDAVDREEEQWTTAMCAQGSCGAAPRKIQRQPQPLPPGTYPAVNLDPHSAEIAVTQAIEALADITIRGELTEPGNVITDITGVPLPLPPSTLDLSLAFTDRCNRPLQQVLTRVRQQQAAGRSVFDFSQADWTAFVGAGLRIGSTRADGSVEASFNGDRLQALVFTLTFTPGVSEAIPEECRRRPAPPGEPSRGGGGDGGRTPRGCGGIDCSQPATPANFLEHSICCRRRPPVEPTPTPGLPPRTVYFFYDTPILKPDSNATLDHVFDALNLFPTLQVQITGHSSREGTEEYNERLSRSRAHAARTLLALRGIDSSRIRTLAMGEYAPAVIEPPEPAPRSLRPAAGEAIRDLNRRAEIVFFDPTGTVAGVPLLPPMILTIPSSFPRLPTRTPRLIGLGLPPPPF